jgi:ankyrin repeat protein
MPALIKRHLPYSLNMQDPHDIAVLLERGDTTLHTEKLTGALKSKIIELLRSANFNDEKLIGLILQKKMYLDPEIEGLLEKHRDKVKSCLSEPQISSYGRAILISHSCDEVAMLYKKYAAEIVMPMYWIGGFYNLKKAIEKLDIEWVHAIIKHGGNINKEMAGRSLLVEMVDQKNLKAVQLLLELGADVNSGDVWGKTPLMRACSIQYWSPSPFFESSLKDTVYKIITLLLEAGADVHAEMRGKSILAFAKEQGDEHIIALLKNAGA